MTLTNIILEISSNILLIQKENIVIVDPVMEQTEPRCRVKVTGDNRGGSVILPPKHPQDGI